jgi:hypothetical protein
MNADSVQEKQRQAVAMLEAHVTALANFATQTLMRNEYVSGHSTDATGDDETG